MRSVLAAGVAAAAVALGIAGQAPAGDVDRQRGLALRSVADFDQPIYAHGPKGAPGLLYVVEREGKVKVMKNGDKRGTFLNISNKVRCCDSERGLFSIAFAPWRRSRSFFAFFTDNQGDLRISEYKRRKNNPLRAKRKSGKTLLDIRHRSAANHNGGQLQWGPDDRLYISTGDGGTGGGPSQNRNSLLGKILRIDPLSRGGYSTPSGNPFDGGPGLDEIFALGLRNPWRFSFDGRKIAIADVGESSSEEVDYERVKQASGANFGWNHYEGNNLINPPAIAGHDRPIHTYSHSDGRCAITGGYVVRDRGLGSLRGKYLYGDLCTGQIRSLKARVGGATNDSATGLVRDSLHSFGVDARKNVYVIASGELFQIVR